MLPTATRGGALFARTAIAVVLGLAVVLVISPAASADTPVHISGSDAGDDFLADCGDFDLRDSFTFEFEGTVFSDDDGNVTRVVEHVGGSDTFYNSVTGESVTGTINSGEIVDFVNGTVTQSGTIGRITVPGEGVFFFDVGKYIIDFEEGLVFLAGSHHAFFEEDYDRLCELLA
jgi:hypothetical protein